jgi:phage FluMu gp28-like protein
MKIHIQNLDYQEKALYTKDKYSCFVAGRQTGKTTAAVNWLIENLLDKDNESGLWVDVRNANIDKYVERYFYPILREVWGLCDWNKQKKILRLPNNSYIDFGSAENPEALEGFHYGFVVLNEAGLILKKSSLWHNTILPMTKRAKVRFVGTPKGKNLFHTLTLQYPTHRITAEESPLWDRRQLEAIQANTPELVWRQEFMAEFLEGEGTVFRGIKKCVKEIKQLMKGEAGRHYVIGVDLAKSQDFTVITVIDEAKREVVCFDRFNQLEWNYQKNKIYEVWQNFNRGLVVIDSTGVGSPIFDDLRRAGVRVEPYQFTSNSKKTLIEGLMLAIENQEISFPDIPELVNELESFEFTTSRSGNISYNAPEGLHDDCVISLALAVYALGIYEPTRFDISFV